MPRAFDPAGEPLPAGDRNRKPGPVGRRLSFGWRLVVALLLGSAAAALPALRGLAGNEARNLRSLAASVACLVLGAAIAARAGRITPSQKGGSRWLEPAMLANSVALIQLPSALVGSDLGLTRELAAQALSFTGWRRPIPLLAILLVTLLLASSIGRLVATRERLSRRSRAGLIAVGLLAVSLAAAAVALLSASSAFDGRERATKLLALGLVAALAAAAAGRETSGSTRVVRFGFVLLLAAGTASVFALHYVTPTPRALAGLELEIESDGWTIVAGPLRGRPELHGVFALPPGGRRLELLEVRPGPADLGDYRPPQAVDGGLARRVGDSDESSLYSDAADRRRGRGEIRIRSRRFPVVDRPAGFTLEDDIVAWTLAPSGRYLVAVRRLPTERARGGGLSSGNPPLRFRLELLGPGSWRSPRILLDKQSTVARVLALDDRAIRILRNGTPSDLSSPANAGARSPATVRPTAGSFSLASSMSYRLLPHYLAIDTWRLDEERWIEGPRSEYQVGRELRLLPGRREAIVACRTSTGNSRESGLCRIDLETLAIRPPAQLPSEERAVRGTTVPLSGERLAIFWYVSELPAQPRRDWRISTFGPTGHELATFELEPGRFALPSRQLEDGSLALAFPPSPAPPRRTQTFGWTLESLDLSTGARRTLATELAAARIRADETPEVFLTRDGRIVVPAATGLHDATRGPRSDVTALPSTGLTSATTRPAPNRTS